MAMKVFLMPLEVSDMKNRLEVQLAPRLIFLEVVDKNGCSDPRRSDFLDESLKCQELAARVDQIVYGENPVSGSDEALGQPQLKVAVLIVRRAGDCDPGIAVE